MPPHSSIIDAIVQVSRVTVTSGDLTTNSTSFVDATGLTTTITTGAHRCLILFTCSVLAQANTDVGLDLAVDGTRLGNTTHGLVLAGNNASNSVYYPASIFYVTDVLSAGSHTFKVQFRVTSGTATINASSGLNPAILTVIELA